MARKGAGDGEAGTGAPVSVPERRRTRASARREAGEAAKATGKAVQETMEEALPGRLGVPGPGKESRGGGRKADESKKGRKGQGLRPAKEGEGPGEVEVPKAPQRRATTKRGKAPSKSEKGARGGEGAAEAEGAKGPKVVQETLEEAVLTRPPKRAMKGKGSEGKEGAAQDETEGEKGKEEEGQKEGVKEEEGGLEGGMKQGEEEGEKKQGEAQAAGAKAGVATGGGAGPRVKEEEVKEEPGGSGMTAEMPEGLWAVKEEPGVSGPVKEEPRGGEDKSVGGLRGGLVQASHGDAARPGYGKGGAKAAKEEPKPKLDAVGARSHGPTGGAPMAGHPAAAAAAESGGEMQFAGFDIGRKISINRAPVLVLWAAVVAEREGFSFEEGLTFGRAISGMFAHSKGKRLGLYEDREATEEERERKRRKEEAEGVSSVEVFGMHLKTKQGKDGRHLAVEDGKPISIAYANSYISKAFGDGLEDAKGAMRALASRFPPNEIGHKAYRLYEFFRPNVPYGVAGWGAKGSLNLHTVVNAASLVPY